jgi:hypothetical protein
MVSVMMSDNYVGDIRRSIAQPADLANYATSTPLVTGIDQSQFTLSKQEYITAPEPPSGYGTNLIDVLRNRYYHDQIIETLGVGNRLCQ